MEKLETGTYTRYRTGEKIEGGDQLIDEVTCVFQVTWIEPDQIDPLVAGKWYHEPEGGLPEGPFDTEEQCLAALEQALAA